MTEIERPSLEDLLQTTPEARQQEVEQGARGLIPERWQKIEGVELAKMRAAVEAALDERKKEWTKHDMEQRKQIAHRYLEEQLLQPSFENGPYAAAHWRNLTEMLSRVIDVHKDAALVPEVDPRVPFYSTQFQKRAIINGLVVDRVQAALGENALNEIQLYDCFTNVSREQVEAVAMQVAQSGLTLQKESPSEKWARLSSSPHSNPQQ